MQLYKLACIGLLAGLVYGCSSDNDPNPNDDPNNPGDSGGKVTITGTSPEFTFWGEELTINGSGFSNVKDENIVTFVNSYPQTPGLKLTSKDGDIEIVSASATKLVIRVPYKSQLNGDYTTTSGEDFARIEVAVDEKKDTTDLVKFLGLPRVGKFEYHYGWYDLGTIAQSGDSVVIDGGFFGSKLYAGENYPKQAGVYDKLKLRVAGVDVPIKYRKIDNSTSGWGLYLSSTEFSSISCDEGANGWNDRAMTFEFYVEGTNIKSSRTMFVTFNPRYTIFTASGPIEVSKSAGGLPSWNVTGEDMYFAIARFSSNCNGGSVVAETAVGNGIKAAYEIGVPLSLLEPNCSYDINLVTSCDEVAYVGKMYLKP